MKNPWLNKKQQPITSMEVPLDYNDPALDFFAAKHRIAEYLKNKYGLDADALGSAFLQDIMDQWAYAADLLSQRAAR